MAISSRAKRNNNRGSSSRSSSGLNIVGSKTNGYWSTGGSRVSDSRANRYSNVISSSGSRGGGSRSPGNSRNTPSRTVSNAGAKRTITRSGQSVTDYFAALRSGSRSPGNSRNTPDRSVSDSGAQRNINPSAVRSGSRSPGVSSPRTPAGSAPSRDRNNTPADSGGLIPSAYGYTQHGDSSGWSGTRNSDAHKLGFAHSRGPGNTADQRADRQTDTNTRLHTVSPEKVQNSGDVAHGSDGTVVSDVAKTGQGMYSVLQNRIGSVVGSSDVRDYKFPTDSDVNSKLGSLFGWYDSVQSPDGAAVGLGGSAVSKDSGIDSILGNVQGKINSDIDDVINLIENKDGEKKSDAWQDWSKDLGVSENDKKKNDALLKKIGNTTDGAAFGSRGIAGSSRISPERDVKTDALLKKIGGTTDGAAFGSRGAAGSSELHIDSVNGHVGLTPATLVSDMAHGFGAAWMKNMGDFTGVNKDHDKISAEWKKWTDSTGVSESDRIKNAELLAKVSDNTALSSRGSAVDFDLKSNAVKGDGKDMVNSILGDADKALTKFGDVTNTGATGRLGHVGDLIGPEQPFQDKWFGKNKVFGLSDDDNPFLHAVLSVPVDTYHAAQMLAKWDGEKAREYGDEYLGGSGVDYLFNKAIAHVFDDQELHEHTDKFYADWDPNTFKGQQKIAGTIMGEALIAAATLGTGQAVKGALMGGLKGGLHASKHGASVVKGFEHLDDILGKAASRMNDSMYDLASDLSTATKRVFVPRKFEITPDNLKNDAVVFEGKFTPDNLAKFGNNRRGNDDVLMSIISEKKDVPFGHEIIKTSPDIKIPNTKDVKYMPGGWQKKPDRVFDKSGMSGPKVPDDVALISKTDSAKDMALFKEIDHVADVPKTGAAYRENIARGGGTKYVTNKKPITDKYNIEQAAWLAKEGIKKETPYMAQSAKFTFGELARFGNRSVKLDDYPVFKAIPEQNTGISTVGDFLKKGGGAAQHGAKLDGPKSRNTLTDLFKHKPDTKPDTGSIQFAEDIIKRNKDIDTKGGKGTGGGGKSAPQKYGDPTPSPRGNIDEAVDTYLHGRNIPGGGGPKIPGWGDVGLGLGSIGSGLGTGLGSGLGSGSGTIFDGSTGVGEGLKDGIIPGLGDGLKGGQGTGTGTGILDGLKDGQGTGTDLGQGTGTLGDWDWSWVWDFGQGTATKTTPGTILDTPVIPKTALRQRTVQNPIVKPVVKPVVPIIPIIPIVPTPLLPQPDEIEPMIKPKSNRKTIGYANNTFKDSFLGFADRGIITYGKAAKQASIGKNPKISLIKTQNIPDINKFKPHSKSTKFVPTASNKFVPSANKSAPSNLVSDVLNKFKPQSGKSMKFKAAVSKFVPIPSVNKFKPQSGKSMKFKPAVSKLPDYTKGFNPKSAKKGMAKNRLMKF